MLQVLPCFWSGSSSDAAGSEAAPPAAGCEARCTACEDACDRAACVALQDDKWGVTFLLRATKFVELVKVWPSPNPFASVPLLRSVQAACSVLLGCFALSRGSARTPPLSFLSQPWLHPSSSPLPLRSSRCLQGGSLDAAVRFARSELARFRGMSPQQDAALEVLIYAHSTLTRTPSTS